MLNDEQVAGLILSLPAFIGVLANWTIALLIRKLPSLKNSFGRLTAAQSVGDAANCTVFAFFVAPMLIFDIKFFKTNSSIIGHVILVCYDISTYSHLCISLNRFCSIVAPISYETIFSQVNTKIIIIFSWAIAILPSFYFYVYSDCRLYYDDSTYIFNYLNTTVCWTIAWYAGYSKYNGIVMLIVLIDVVTVSKVRSFKAKMSRSTSQSNLKKSRAEMNFLKQACLQAFIFVCELFGAFVIMPRMDPSIKWYRFGLSTVAWVSVHTFDGLITLAFNKEFTQIVFCGIKIKDLSSYASRNNVINNNNFFVIAFTGFLANWTVTFLIRKLPSLRNSFGKLTAAESLAGAVNSTIFAFIVAPMIFFDIKPLKSYSTVIGHILIDFYDISICSHLCISFNRFCSIVAPLYYSTIFSPSNTKIIIFITWGSVIIPSFYLYIYLDCRLFWDDATLIFQFRSTVACQNVIFYSGFVKTSIITFLVVVINMITVLRVRSYKAKMAQYNSQSHQKKSRAEMNFLKQACLQAVLFVIEILLSFVVNPGFDPSLKWPSFLFITVTWAFVHMIDGIITLTFNKEFAQVIFGSNKTKNLSVNSSHNTNKNVILVTNTASKI